LFQTNNFLARQERSSLSFDQLDDAPCVSPIPLAAPIVAAVGSGSGGRLALRQLLYAERRQAADAAMFAALFGICKWNNP
jgi:hypothetical protein